MAKKRVVLTFPPELTEKPITYHLVKDFDLAINILRAKITPGEEGKLVLELSNGSEEMIKKGLDFLVQQGVGVEAVSKEISLTDEDCIHCGACTAVCQPELYRSIRIPVACVLRKNAVSSVNFASPPARWASSRSCFSRHVPEERRCLPELPAAPAGVFSFRVAVGETDLWLETSRECRAEVEKEVRGCAGNCAPISPGTRIFFPPQALAQRSWRPGTGAADDRRRRENRRRADGCRCRRHRRNAGSCFAGCRC